MTDGHDLERRVAAFYATEAPPRAPDRVLLDALATIDTTRQRRELALVPWRIQTMNSNARLVMAAVAVIAVGALGFAILQPGSGSSVGAPNPTPSASPSAPPATPPPASQDPAPPALTGSFTSAIHGLSMSYPAGWTVVPATEDDWTVGVSFLAPGSDWIYDPQLEANLFFVLGSAALDGQTGDAWAATVFGDPEADCDAVPEPITVDGAAGLFCDMYALTWVGDRGYSIRLYVSGDDPKVVELYDRAWFDDVLATVQLPSQP